MKSVNSPLFLCALAGIAAMTSSAAAQPGQPRTYHVEHSVKLKTPGNLAPEVRHKYVLDTYARTDKAIDNPPREEGFVLAPGGNYVTQTAGPVPSFAFADSLLVVNALMPGMLDATYDVFGIADAELGKRSAYAEAYSYSNVFARGQKEDRKGNIKFRGGWKHGRGVAGRARSGIRVDPVVGRLIDNTTGEVKQWTLIETKSRTNYGEFAWENDTVTSDAADLFFELNVPGVITAESGTLRLRVENGIVVESVETGMFAGSGVPPVGAPAGFAFSLPNEISVDYDMGGDENHDLEVEIEADNAAMESDALNAHDNGGIVTDLGAAPDAVMISEPIFPQTMLGLAVTPGMIHVMDNFTVPPGLPLPLDVMQVPVILPPGVSPNSLEFMVNLFLVDPFTGQPIPFAMSPGSVIESVRETGIYRIPHGAPASVREFPIVEVTLDMSWAPLLLPEQEIYIELMPLSLQSTQPIMLVPAVDRFDEQRDALVHFVQGNQFQPALDQQTGIPMDVSFILFQNGPEAPCYADCDGSGGLDFFDFLCFQNEFNSGSSYADCDGSGGLDFFDFLCFQNEFNAGCP